MSFFKRHWKKLLISIVILIGAFAGWRIVSGGNAQTQLLTQPLLRGDLQQTVEGIATIISENDLSLKFQGQGVVASVNVKAGDRVRRGQTLATLKAPELAASIQSQRVIIEARQIALDQVRKGARTEEIAVSEAQLRNKEASLDASEAAVQSAKNTLEREKSELELLKKQASTGISGEISTVISTLRQQLITTQNSLSVAEDIMNKNDFNEALTWDSPYEKDVINKGIFNSKQEIPSILIDLDTVQTYEEVVALLPEIRNAVNKGADTVNRLFTALLTVIETNNFTREDREAYKGNLSSPRSNLQSALATIETQQNSLEQTPLDYESQVLAAEGAVKSAEDSVKKAEIDLATAQSSLEIERANYNLKIAGSTTDEVRASENSLKQAQADLAKIQAQYSQYVLTSPIDGVVAKMNLRIGELTPSDTAIQVLGDTPARLEMFVADVDLPKLALSQTGTTMFDAYPDIRFQVRVSSIDPVTTLVDGTESYRVLLDFVYPHPELSVGLAGNVTIVTREKRNVLLVPERAIAEDESGNEYVVIQDGEQYYRQRIETGMRGSTGEAEIISGLNGTEILILNTDDPSLQRLLANPRSAQSTQEQRITSSGSQTASGSSILPVTGE